jgi:hypothetical protein
MLSICYDTVVTRVAAGTRGGVTVRKLTALAIATIAAVGGSTATVGPALAGAGPAAHAGARASHGPRMNISFASGPGSSAHWLPRQQAVQFRVGADTGGGSGPSPEFAEIVVHHFPATAPAQEPSFTVTGPGSPYLEIGFAGGGHLQRAAGDGSTAWTAYDSANNVLAAATDYATALAAEQATGSALTVDQVILIDAQVAQGAAFTDTITSLEYNGVSLVPRSHHHGSAHT